MCTIDVGETLGTARNAWDLCRNGFNWGCPPPPTPPSNDDSNYNTSTQQTKQPLPVFSLRRILQKACHPNQCLVKRVTNKTFLCHFGIRLQPRHPNPTKTMAFIPGKVFLSLSFWPGSTWTMKAAFFQ